MFTDACNFMAHIIIMVFLLSDQEEFESEKRSAPKPTFFWLVMLFVGVPYFSHSCGNLVYKSSITIYNCIFSGDNDIDSISQISLAALISHCVPTFSDLYKM